MIDTTEIASFTYSLALLNGRDVSLLLIYDISYGPIVLPFDQNVLLPPFECIHLESAISQSKSSLRSEGINLLSGLL